MASIKKISNFIDRMVPAHIKDENPDFIIFMRAYLEFLETEPQFDPITGANTVTPGPANIVANLLVNNDIDNSIKLFYDKYHAKYAPKLPKQAHANNIILFKHLKEFYKQKGTEDSFKWLFRAYYEQDISFYYPTVDILRASDGKWHKPIQLIVVDSNGQYPANLADIVKETVVGGTSGDSGVVDSIKSTFDPLSIANVVIQALSVVSSDENFVRGEEITLKNANNNPVTYTILDHPDAIKTQAGLWIGTDSQLSSNKYLHDNHFYQDLSYMIKAGIPSVTYRNMVKQTIHPAGMMLFGIVEQINKLAYDAKMLSVARDNTESIQWHSTGRYSTQARDNFEYWNQSKVNSASNTYKSFQTKRETTPYLNIMPVSVANHVPANDFVTKADQTFPWTLPADLFVNRSLWDTQYINSAWLTYGYFMANRETNPILSQIVPVGALDALTISYYEANPGATLPYTRTTSITNNLGAVI